MIRRLLVPLGSMFVIGMLVFAPDARARELPVGKWTGKLVLESRGHVLDMSFLVAKAEDGSLGITLNTGESSFITSKVRYADGKLRFSWLPGETSVDCVLQSDAETGVFSGACGKESQIRLKMVPPSE